MVNIGYLNFFKCEGGYQVGNGNTGSGISSVPEDGFVKIPSHIFFENNRYKVVALSPNCFQNKGDIKTVILPDTLINISQNSFWKTGIAELFIPKSVKYINTGGFSDMPYLTKIVFESGIVIKSAGSTLFNWCVSLKEIFYCGTADLSSISNPFQGLQSIPTIYVPISYPSTQTFGGRAVNRTVLCHASKQEKVTCRYHRSSSHNDLFLFFLIIGLVR